MLVLLAPSIRSKFRNVTAKDGFQPPPREPRWMRLLQRCWLRRPPCDTPPAYFGTLTLIWSARILASRRTIVRWNLRRRISSGCFRRWPCRRQSEGRRRGQPPLRRADRHRGSCGRAPYLLRGFPWRGPWRISFHWPSQRREEIAPPLGRPEWRKALSSAIRFLRARLLATRSITIRFPGATRTRYSGGPHLLSDYIRGRPRCLFQSQRRRHRTQRHRHRSLLSRPAAGVAL
jgi:hypothetical protein